MIILIDAGNTRIKFGWIDPANGQREAAPLALRHADLEEQLPAWLRQLPHTPAAAMGINVAGAAIAGRLGSLLGTYVERIDWIRSVHSALNVRNAYDMPEQLGADRWVALLGLAEHVRQAKNPGHPPLLLASFGTATTIDTLAPSGMAEVANQKAPLRSHNEAGRAPSGECAQKAYVFRGGLILPGPSLMAASLANGTAQLPQAQGFPASHPTHTHQAIVSGIAAAQAGAVLRQWMAGLELCGQAPRIYATGGGWSAIKEETERLLAAARTQLGHENSPIEWLASPVLDGLASLATTDTHPR